MRRIARRLLCVLLLLFCFSDTAYATTPLKSYMEIKDGRHLFTKTFEAGPEEDSSQLIENPFEQDGFSYAYYETAKELIPLIEKREEIQAAEISTESNDTKAILQLLEQEKDYEGEDGFSGKLLLDPGSIKTEVEDYTTKTFTVRDSATIMGLSNNDPANVPKTMYQDGVTLSLQSVDWSAQQSESVDYETIPTMYKAVAHYSGSYTKQVPTGYVSTVEYKGEVTKTEIEKVIYTLTYIGTELPKSAPMPEPEPDLVEDELQETGISLKWLIAGTAIFLVIMCGTLALFFLFYYNTFIYLKNGDEYSLIAKRRIKWSNPVVDLNGLDISGKEVAVNVKKCVAERLFGRHIKTVVDGNAGTRCLVDRHGGDFWYVVGVPDLEKDAE